MTSEGAEAQWEPLRERGRVVVFRPGALGDALLAFPALAWLRTRRPGAHVTLIGPAGVLSLARASGLADAAHVFDLPAWAGLWGGAARADPLLREVVAGADAVVGWMRDPDGEVARTLSALGVERVVMAPVRPLGGNGEGTHVALAMARTLEPLRLGNPPQNVEELARCLPSFASTPAGAAAAEAVWTTLGLPARGVVALHPGSGGAAKRWPAASFAEVANRLREDGCVPVVIEGPADAEPASEMMAAMAHTHQPPGIARNLSIEALAALLAKCGAYVGNDSGVSHLAAQVGIPTLALFGPTDPGVWGPIGQAVRTVRAERTVDGDAGGASMTALPVDRVWRELAALRASAPVRARYSASTPSNGGVSSR